MPHDTLAAVFLVLLVSVAVTLVVRDFRRCRFTIVQYFFWRLARGIARMRWHASIPDFPLEDDQGAIVVCNHRSSVDPVFIQAVVRRPVHWMVAKEYYKSRMFGRFLKMCETIPVNRGGIDTAATKYSIRLAQEGGLVGMFPEGRINATEKFMLACRPGAILIALKGNTPLLPCYIEGAPFDGTPLSPLGMPAVVRVTFGQPIDLSKYQSRHRDETVVAEVLKECVRAIAKMAGEEDFEPTLAGRRWRPSDEEVAADMEAARERRAKARNGGE